MELVGSVMWVLDGTVSIGTGRNFEKWSRKELWSLMSGAGGKHVK